MFKKVLRITVVSLILLFPCFNIWAAPGDTPLKYGSRGEDVITLQKLLAKSGFYVDTFDGVFDNGTVGAVRAFQRSNGLTEDGVVNKESFIYRTC